MTVRGARGVATVIALLLAAVPVQAQQGIAPLRGGWGLPPVEAPAAAKWDEASAGAEQLHQAIAQVGSGDLAGALRKLEVVQRQTQRLGHEQEVRYYSGVALSIAGLRLSAARAFAEALAGPDAGLAKSAARRLLEAEGRWTGLAGILSLPDPSTRAAELPPQLLWRQAVARADRAARAGRPRQARRLLEAIPDAWPGQDVRSVRAAALIALQDPAKALATLTPSGSADVSLAAARLAYSIGEVQTALPLFRAASKGSQAAEATVGEGWTLARLGDWQAAAERSGRLARSKRPPPGSRELAALVHLHSCAFDEAAPLIDAAAEAGELRVNELDAGKVRVRPRPWAKAILRQTKQERDVVASEALGLPDRIAGPLRRGLDALDRELKAQLAAGARAGRPHALRGARAWLRLSLQLRHELLERRKQDILAALGRGEAASDRDRAPETAPRDAPCVDLTAASSPSPSPSSGDAPK